MNNKSKVRAIVWTLETWAGVMSFLFMSNNWEVFVQFIRTLTPAALTTLLLPTFLAGIVAKANWPKHEKKPSRKTAEHN